MVDGGCCSGLLDHVQLLCTMCIIYMYAYTHEYMGVGILIHLNHLNNLFVLRVVVGVLMLRSSLNLEFIHVQLCTCARPVMEPWYYGRYYGCLRGWWSQYWIVIIDYDH